MVSLWQCKQDVYKFEGREYKWYYDLEKALNNKTKVEALDLSNQNLKKVPVEVSELKYLKFISLKGNQLKELPQFIYHNQKIQTLLLTSNRSIRIDSKIGEISNLKVLSLLDCNLDELPKAIFDLKELRYLLIAGNNFNLEQIETFRKNLPYCKIADSLD